MRQIGTAQEASRQELVVRGEKRTGCVQDDDAARLERTERPQAVVDSVECRQHVEAAERNVFPARSSTSASSGVIGSQREPSTQAEASKSFVGVADGR